MAAPAPVEVGAQGTVGSLVFREIQYFTRMEVGVGHDCHGKKSSKAAAANGGSPRVKKQKKGSAGGGAFLPSMCSSAEIVANDGSGRRERPARVRYRHLGEEGDSVPQE